VNTGQRRPSRLDPVDGIYLKVRGRWAYLSRAIDRDGRLVDTMPNLDSDGLIPALAVA
jgi:transposase-like protein